MFSRIQTELKYGKTFLSYGNDVLGFSMATFLSEYFSVGLTLQYFLNSGLIIYDFESEELAYTQEFSEPLPQPYCSFFSHLYVWKNKIKGSTGSQKKPIRSIKN